MIVNDVLKEAEELSKEFNYDFEEACGDMIGGLIYELDALLYSEDKQRLGEKFCKRIEFHMRNFSNGISMQPSK